MTEEQRWEFWHRRTLEEMERGRQQAKRHEQDRLERLEYLLEVGDLRRENEAQIADIAALVAEVAVLRADVARLTQHECDDQHAISTLTLENVRLREQVRRLTDQHGTFPYLGYKSELKGL